MSLKVSHAITFHVAQNGVGSYWLLEAKFDTAFRPENHA